jgi:hypothetical protein
MAGTYDKTSFLFSCIVLVIITRRERGNEKDYVTKGFGGI